MKNLCKPLLIDHDDSFTFILAQYLGELVGHKIPVLNHQTATLEEIQSHEPTHLILSPGPGTVDHPEDFKIGLQVLDHFKEKLPILGVCLGHQGIAKYFGAQIIHAPKALHGIRDLIQHDGSTLFKSTENPLQVMRYHSLIVDPKTFPDSLKITATSEDGSIMALQHKSLPIFGLQFHPESVGTSQGMQILRNFLDESH